MTNMVLKVFKRAAFSFERLAQVTSAMTSTHNFKHSKQRGWEILIKVILLLLNPSPYQEINKQFHNDKMGHVCVQQSLPQLLL